MIAHHLTLVRQLFAIGTGRSVRFMLAATFVALGLSGISGSPSTICLGAESTLLDLTLKLNGNPSVAAAYADVFIFVNGRLIRTGRANAQGRFSCLITNATEVVVGADAAAGRFGSSARATVPLSRSTTRKTITLHANLRR